MLARVVFTIILLLPITTSAAKIIPHTDISYAGSFRMPGSTTEDQCFQWNYISGNIEYYPAGNSGAGSLFVTGKTGCPTLAEVSIPTLKSRLTNAYSALNTATVLQPFTDVGNGDLLGLPDGAAEIRGVGDVVLVGTDQGLSSSRLLLVSHDNYVNTNDSEALAVIDTNFSDGTVGFSGWWQITTDGSTTVNAAEYTHYAFLAPTDWATANTSGRSVIVGQNRQNTGGSFGATMYAVGLGWGSTTPANGTDLSATKLISYGNSANMNHYMESNNPADMTWVKAGTKDSIVALFDYSQRNRLYSELATNDWTETASGWYYGNRHPEGAGSKGYHGEPYHHVLLLYDPADILAATPSTAQPYATFDISKYMYREFVESGENSNNIAGIAYDTVNGRLFVAEGCDDKTGGRIIIHVFTVSDNSGTLDTTAPTAPSILTITDKSSTHINLSWTGSTDSETDVHYIIYDNGYPVIRTTETSYDYTYIAAWAAGNQSVESGWPAVTSHVFKVVAQDSYQNQSGFSNTVSYGESAAGFGLNGSGQIPLSGSGTMTLQ